MQPSEAAVSLEEMLIARERRAAIQNTLIQTYRAPIISFTLNIPGPVKVFGRIPDAFHAGCALIEQELEHSGFSFLLAQTVEEKTGYEAFFCADGPPEELKRLMSHLEDSVPAGRLYDIDVLRADGTKVSREEFGLPPRTCLLCGEPAHSCSRSRRHSIEELLHKISEILDEASDTPARRFIEYTQSALRASLIDEVSATPKPGLVDLHDCGAHRDMDYHTFMASAAAITPFLTDMAKLGLNFRETGETLPGFTKEESLFMAIRPIGKEAEAAMFAATKNVNTHKGAIFSLGIVAAAAGFLFAGRLAESSGGPGTFSSAPFLCGADILAMCHKMCGRPLEADFASLSRSSPKTHGERLFIEHGVRGIRGEAASGFSSVKTCSLPFLKEEIALSPPRSREDYNRICLTVFLQLMANVDDTNVLYRTDYESLLYARECAGRILSTYPHLFGEGIRALQDLNADFTARNISPGGCADLLAVTLFLWRMEQFSPY